VTMSTVVERLTADEYLARDDPRRTELIDGVVVVNQPTILHQHVCVLFLEALGTWTKTPAGRGVATLPLNLVLDEANVLAPDVMWFHAVLPLDVANPPRLPDLVIEVRSPSTWRYDVGRKRELYQQHGVRELWLVDTSSRSVLMYRGDDAEELGPEATLTSPMLPGFAASVGALIPAA
jgi:Uma2 family endonuclease